MARLFLLPTCCGCLIGATLIVTSANRKFGQIQDIAIPSLVEQQTLRLLMSAISALTRVAHKAESLPILFSRTHNLGQPVS